MNKIGKGILIAIIVVVGLVLIKAATTPIISPNKYAAEAVRVLEKYKNFEIDEREADNRLRKLMDEISDIKEKTKDKEEKTKMLNLWLEIMPVQSQLHHFGSASGYEVDEAIEAIKKHY